MLHVTLICVGVVEEMCWMGQHFEVLGDVIRELLRNRGRCADCLNHNTVRPQAEGNQRVTIISSVKPRSGSEWTYSVGDRFLRHVPVSQTGNQVIPFGSFTTFMSYPPWGYRNSERGPNRHRPFMV